MKYFIIGKKKDQFGIIAEEYNVIQSVVDKDTGTAIINALKSTNCWESIPIGSTEYGCIDLVEVD